MSPDGVARPAALSEPIEMTANPVVALDDELGCTERFAAKDAF
jgi:hypothetical protein